LGSDFFNVQLDRLGFLSVFHSPFTAGFVLETAQAELKYNKDMPGAKEPRAPLTVLLLLFFHHLYCAI